MTELSLEALGLTKESLETKIVDRAAEMLIYEDERTGEEMADRLTNLVQATIDAQVNKIADEHVIPRVAEMVESVTLQATNSWGEAKSEPLTFREYLVKRTEAYITEKVNHAGKTKSEDGFNWRPDQTRISYMVHQHLQYEIENAIKTALKDFNSNLSKGIQETVKIQLDQALGRLKVQAKV